MPLSKVDRERITDSVLKIQSVRAQLDHLDDTKLSEIEEIKDCLDDADDTAARCETSAFWLPECLAHNARIRNKSAVP